MREFSGFGLRLTQAMRASRMSGVALGALLGVSKQTVSNWKADRNQPDICQLFYICRALQVTADYLVLGEAHGLSLRALKIATGYDKLTPEARSQWESALDVLAKASRHAGPRELGDATQQDEGVTWAQETKRSRPPPEDTP